MEMTQMIAEKDYQIIANLRKNARVRITDIARKTSIPVTTIYDRVRVHEKKKLFKRHVTLLDFAKLGLFTKSQIALKADKDSREALQKYLFEHPHVNSLLRVNFSSDFLVEVVFNNIADVENFVERLQQNFKITNYQIYNVIEDLKREDFLTKDEHFLLVK